MAARPILTHFWLVGFAALSSAAALVPLERAPLIAAEPRPAVRSDQPKVADRDQLRVRVVNRNQQSTGVVRRAQPIDPDSQVPAAPEALAPEAYRSDEVARDMRVDDIVLTQRPIGLGILDRAAAQPEPGKSPENFAAQVIANQKPCVFGTSRYREDFVIPVDRAASEFCYRPLYFEQVNLERYGVSHGPWQPFISGARFFATVPTLPYQMVVHRPCVCRYWSHDFPAGRRAPCWEREAPPFSLDAAGVEGLAVFGLILLIP